MANPGVSENVDLFSYTMKNTDGAALDTRTMVAFDETDTNNVGMVALADSNAGEIAGVIMDKGVDLTTSTTGFPVNNIPVGQWSRVARRGRVKIRTTNVAITRGNRVYVLTASGKVTNTANSGANPYVGIAMNTTGGATDELCEVDLEIRGSAT